MTDESGETMSSQNPVSPRHDDEYGSSDEDALCGAEDEETFETGEQEAEVREEVDEGGGRQERWRVKPGARHKLYSQLAI